MKAFCFYLNLLFSGFVSSSDTNFVYNSFLHADLSLDGASHLRTNGILSLTNDSVKLIGQPLYPSPIHFKTSKHNTVVTFSTNFVFSMFPKFPSLGGDGLAFVLLSTKSPAGCLPNQYLGLPNDTGNSAFSTHVLAVEFDAVQNLELMDINDNHVGIDISSLISNVSKPATYYSTTNNRNNSVFFKSGDPIQAWIEYNSQEKLMNVTISPLGIPKSFRPLISFPIDLSMLLNEYMYVGFSASTGLLAATHNVHGWSFMNGGRAADLDSLRLPYPTMDEYDSDEIVLVLSLGLLCAHPHPDYRPDMRRVVQYLLKDVCLPELPPDVFQLHVSGAMIDYSDTYPDV